MAGDLKLIGVAGGSGSGKTLFSNLLARRLPKATILSLDQYYLNRPDGVPNEKHDYDVPPAFDFRLYRQHFDDLRQGKPIRMPQFDWESGKRRRETVRVAPGNYLILEGLYILMHASLRGLLSYSFFLESPPDVAVVRRCLRDVRKQGVTAEYCLNQYLTFVRPAYLGFVQPTKQFANLVIENGPNSRLDYFADRFLQQHPL